MQTQTKGWAVVTGASSGFGLLFAKELVKKGYPVLAVVAAALGANARGKVLRVVGPVNNILSFVPRLLPRAAMRSLMASFSRPKA